MRAAWNVGKAERRKRLRRRAALSLLWAVNLIMVFEAAILLLFWKTPVDVKRITVVSSSFDGLVHYKEKRVDVENCLYYEYEMPQVWQERNPEAENEGFQLVRELDRDEMKRFIGTASRYGFWGWWGMYDDPNVCDGGSWSLLVEYRDGGSHSLSGYVKRPAGWRKVSEGFLRLTGEWM